jgi:hypothetical protein
MDILVALLMALLFQRYYQLHELQGEVGEDDFGVAVLPQVLQGEVQLLVQAENIFGVDEG